MWQVRSSLLAERIKGERVAEFEAKYDEIVRIAAKEYEDNLPSSYPIFPLPMKSNDYILQLLDFSNNIIVVSTGICYNLPCR